LKEQNLDIWGNSVTFPCIFNLDSDWSVLLHRPFNARRKIPGPHLVRGRMGPRPSLNTMVISLPHSEASVNQTFVLTQMLSDVSWCDVFEIHSRTASNFVQAFY